MRTIIGAALAAVAMLAGCSEVQVGAHLIKKESAPACVAEGHLKVGNPYIIDGKRYTPIASSHTFRERGIASWYGDDFHGKPTANGECFNMYAFTAAHKTLPLPTILRVTNLENNRSIVVKVNDRGPFVGSRILDLSYASAQSLDIARNGTAPVLIEAIGGPHHHADGAKGLLAERQKRGDVLAGQLGPRDYVAPTLPTVVPEAIDSEELAPQVAGNSRVAQALNAGQPSEPAPVPAYKLPNPPERADVPNSSPLPLHHTRIYVQVGAYSDKSAAMSQLAKLNREQGGSSLAPLTRQDGSTLWRVRTAAFNSVADAESALARMKAAGFNSAQIKVEKE